MWRQFNDIADLDFSTISNPGNFYPFNRERAANAAAYRKALKAELVQINDNVSRLSSLPRSNTQPQ